MEQFKQFDIKKQAAIGSLEQVRKILLELGEMDFDVKEDLQKIDTALKSIESDVLRIALLGAFSDGKTSVIAAWLGKIMDNMKIDIDESSDQIAIYKPEGLPGKCEIVDTPGLFGDKEKAVDGTHIMYQDVTKQYISEAHLIFYVVDATNPLKESHNSIAKWILRDLNKLSSTIFVINKMDEVTDLTEKSLFDDQANIKKDNLKSKLQRAANLTSDELTQLNIVCIASNPNGRGLEFWFSKPEHYESRSRIRDLKEMTTRILQSHVPEVLIAKTGMDVVCDVVMKKLNDAQSNISSLVSFEVQNIEESTRIQQNISQGRSEVKRMASELFRELQSLENQLIGCLRPLSLEEIRSFLEDNIGYTEDGVGYKLHLQIKMTIDHFFDQSSAITKRISLDIGRQLDSSESFMDALIGNTANSMGTVLNGVSKLDPSIIKGTIVAARDVLGQVTGVAYKFKPWEAGKLAAGVTKWAGPAGVVFSLGMDLYKTYKAQELEQELTEVKNEINLIIKNAFKDVYDLLSNDEKMFNAFAPQLKHLDDIVKEMDKRAKLISAKKSGISNAQEKLQRLILAN
jgi:GTPase SAR1 family protein